MYTRFDFPEIFRKKLYQKASVLVEKKTRVTEKEMLEQHFLLSELTDLEWKPAFEIEKRRKVGIFIGAAEGLDNVHEAYFLGREIKNCFSGIDIRYITSGAIGVTVGKAKEMGVPGTNARVMSQLLYEYGAQKDEVITEDRSLHTDMQATEMKKILTVEKISEVIAVTDYWHCPRLLMTFIGRNPSTKWYSSIVESDKDNIGSAQFDWGQKIFQTPLLIAEVARIHEYVEKKMGPASLEELCEYFVKYYPKKLAEFIKYKKLLKLKYLWDKTHTEILNNFDKYSRYR